MQCDRKTLHTGAIGSANRARNYATRHDGHSHVLMFVCNVNRSLNIARAAATSSEVRGSLSSAIATRSMLTRLDLLIAHHGTTLRFLVRFMMGARSCLCGSVNRNTEHRPHSSELQSEARRGSLCCKIATRFILAPLDPLLACTRCVQLRVAS